MVDPLEMQCSLNGIPCIRKYHFVDSFHGFEILISPILFDLQVDAFLDSFDAVPYNAIDCTADRLSELLLRCSYQPLVPAKMAVPASYLLLRKLDKVCLWNTAPPSP